MTLSARLTDGTVLPEIHFDSVEHFGKAARAAVRLARGRGPAIETGDGPLARRMRESIAKEREEEREGLSGRMKTKLSAPKGTCKEIPSPDEFDGAEFLELDELREMGDHLIGEYEELAFLAEHQLRYLWKADGGKSKGSSTLGKCILTSGLVEYFGLTEWVIWLAADHCRAMEFTDVQVEALLYHELLHCALKGKAAEEPAVKGHDFELFGKEIQRYGFWHPGVRVAKEAVQGRLALEDAGAA